MNEVLGAKVRHLREQKSWSQEHLAGAARISVRTVQRIEGGKGAGKEALLAIAGALSVSVEDLRTDPRQGLAQRLGVAPQDVTPELIAKKAEELKAKYSSVPLVNVKTAADLMVVFEASALHLNCITSVDEIQDLAAELEAFLTDLLDLSDVCDSVGRREYAKNALEIIKQINDKGSVVSIGLHNHLLSMAANETETIPWSTLYVFVAPVEEVKAVALVEKEMRVKFRF